MCILCVHIETSSLWEEFVNKNRCISVRLVSEEDIKAYNFDNSHNSFLWPEYFKDGSHVRLWHPSSVYITAPERVHSSTKDAYTSEPPCILTLLRVTYTQLYTHKSVIWKLFKTLLVNGTFRNFFYVVAIALCKRRTTFEKSCV